MWVRTDCIVTLCSKCGLGLIYCHPLSYMFVRTDCIVVLCRKCGLGLIVLSLFVVKVG